MTPTAYPCRTLARTITVSGVGIHTGARARATLTPARTVGAGVVFRQADTGQEIPARASNVTETSRCTVLGRAGASLSTVEHLLSALAGLGVTDCIVEVDGPELPIGDGSALIWTEALAQAGLTDLPGAGAGPLRLREPVVAAGQGGAFIAGFPSETTRYTVAIVYEHALVGTQVARFEPAREAYGERVAPARTFGFIEEVEALRAAGRARGGSFENAVVIYADHFSTPLRTDDELARHKLLDLIGDLALLGRPLIADVVAVKPSHRLNNEFARLLETRPAAPPGSPEP